MMDFFSLLALRGFLGGGSGGTSGSGTSDAVQYIPQTLTEEQQMQARENLGLYHSKKGIGTVLAETSVPWVEDMGAYILTDPITIIAEEQYTLNLGSPSISFECVAKTFTEYNEETGEELGTMTCLGNASFWGFGEDTGEQFALVIAPPDLAAESGYSAMLVHTYGTGGFTVLSITGTVEVVTPVPDAYLEGYTVKKAVFTQIAPLVEWLNVKRNILKGEFDAGDSFARYRNLSPVYFEEDGVLLHLREVTSSEYVASSYTEAQTHFRVYADRMNRGASSWTIDSHADASSPVTVTNMANDAVWSFLGCVGTLTLYYIE